MVLSHFSRRYRAKGAKVEIEHFVEDLVVGSVCCCLDEEVAMAAPHRVHEQHRAQHARGDLRIHAVEFATFDATLKNACHESAPPLDDLARVESYEVGKAAQLSVDEPEERGELG